jgi:murein DD-endopeptidase MepM/ murein hydrolase activator NlpD
VTVKKTGVPAWLIPTLLGFVLFALLGWRFLRIDSGDSPMRERTVTLRSRSPRVTAKAPVPQRRNVGDTRTAPSPHELSMPVAGVDPRTLHDNFSETRGGTRPHGALDIVAPRGTPVLAADDGVVRKLFTSVPGGLTVYEFDLEERYCYYYAHLDGYAPDLHEGQRLRKGDLVGYVGTTGNARKDAPHLHFAVSRLDPDKKWWTGTPIDPYPLLVKAP